MKDLVPKEGATGWLDTWMVSSHTKNLDCAYKWLAWISTPKVQAEQAIYFGETPVNSKACAIMDKLSKGSCAQYHANAPLKYFKQIHFWKTPIAECGNGQKNCMDYTKWQQAWTAAQGLRPPASERAAVSAARSGAGPGCKAVSLLSPPVARVPRSSTSRRSSRCSSRRSGRSTRSRATRSHLDARQLPQLWHGRPYRTVALRTIGIAAAVTITDAIIAFPFAYFMARLAGAAHRAVLFVLVLLPLWACYLARVYAWQLILNPDGLLNSAARRVARGRARAGGLPGAGGCATRRKAGRARPVHGSRVMNKPPLAVALQYDKSAVPVPRVVAKGRGDTGEAILRLAREHGVPVEENAPLAEALSQVELGEDIPEALYRAVAEVLIFILRASGKIR